MFFIPLLLISSQSFADSTANTAIGGGIGGALGAAVGNEIGGKDGAVFGGALGGVTGAAIATDDDKKEYHYKKSLRLITIESPAVEMIMVPSVRLVKE